MDGWYINRADPHQYQLMIMKWLLVGNMEAAILRNITRAIGQNTKVHQSKGPNRFYISKDLVIFFIWNMF